MVVSPRIYLLHGKETFLKQQYLEKIKSNFKVKNSSWINFENYFADEDDISKIASTGFLFPFDNQFRVSIIKNIDRIQSDKQDSLLTFLKDVPSQSIVVLITSAEDTSSSFINKLSKLPHVKQITCEVKGYKNINQWIVNSVQEKSKKKISNEAVSILLERTDTSLLNLDNEIEKLILYSGDDKVIGIEHVNKIIKRNVHYNAFKLIDSICEKDIDKAMYILDQMFIYNISIVEIVGALGWQLSRMLRAKVLVVKEKLRPLRLQNV